MNVDESGQQRQTSGVNRFGVDVFRRVSLTKRRNLLIAREQPTTLDVVGWCHQFGIAKQERQNYSPFIAEGEVSITFYSNTARQQEACRVIA